LEQIKSLARAAGITIRVFKETFNGSRESYFKKLGGMIDDLRGKMLIVFLDPDTGIAPTRHGPEHVRSEELRAVFSQLKSLDWLVLYQHRQRRRDWVEHNHKEFAKAIDVPQQKVGTFSAFKLASDVVLLAAQKSGV